MANASIDGLVSGLDTTSLIASLMAAEALPQTALKTKVTDTNAVVTAYQSVNTRYAALQTAAESLANSATWTTPTAHSSATSVSAIATATAAVGQLSFDVLTTAAAHSVATAEFGQLSDISTSTPPIITITQGGNPVTISPSSGDLATVIQSINDAAGLGVRAVAIQVSAGRYRIQLSAKDSGTASSFTVDGLGATTTVRPAADASIDLGGGLVVTSPTNTFTDVLPGVSFIVSKPELGVTVSAVVDNGGLADKVQAMVDAANAALTEIGKQTAYDATNKVGGVLLSDSGVRQLQSDTLNGVADALALAGPPPTSGSAAIAGIQTDRDGKLTFDRDTFLALQAADPVQAQALAQGVAVRLAAVAKGATDATTGSLTLAVQGRNALIKDLNTSISDWDDRLAVRQAALKAQFSAMEVALSALQSQSSWLAGQIASLPTNSTG
jgi:flagellar hook-associated protein 2